MSEGLDLLDAVNNKIKQVRTRQLDVSFNELMSMYELNELIIDPAYQRLFRWDQTQQSRFVESIILELPIPPIFVIERDDGSYELIDGLQRISSYLHFRGAEFKAEVKKIAEDYEKFENAQNEEGEEQCEDEDVEEKINEKGISKIFSDLSQGEALKLQGCDIVTELNGKTYDTLPTALQIRLKRNYVRMEVVRRESDPRIRYYMFRRLNEGGSILSHQEKRNCTIRLLSDAFINFIDKLAQNSDFRICISNIGIEKVKRQFAEELVLRYFAFKNYRKYYRHDVEPFMTKFMELVSEKEIVFDYLMEEQNFINTFKILKLVMGDKVFAPISTSGNPMARFLAYHYEAFALGIQPLLPELQEASQDVITQTRDIFMEIKQNTEFKEMTTGGGKNFAEPLNKRIRFVTQTLEKELNLSGTRHDRT